MYKTKISTIEDLVFAYQIINEKKKDKNINILTVNIKFDQKKISSFLKKNSFSYADVANISLTLLPVLVEDKEVFIFSENFFYNNWLNTQNEIKNTNDILINYNLALENIEDLQYINLNKENLELIDVKQLTSFNEIEDYVFLLIYFTENKFKAFIRTFIENKEIDKSLDLKIYPDDETKTYKEAVLTLKDEISQIWKSQNLIDVSTPSFLDLYLDVKKIDDYLNLRSIINSLDIIEDYSVLEMTNKYTKVRLKYKGKISKLRDKLLEKKTNIKIVNNIWRVTVN